ncbi:hypothetical protein CC2G_004216 [Coprinopsis cinerea AmutBmut pab1-1]|nr:hypothetical protein CC2G_004216 [Coprinopsis cinerea AmutBmut pab1-1]
MVPEGMYRALNCTISSSMKGRPNAEETRRHRSFPRNRTRGLRAKGPKSAVPGPTSVAPTLIVSASNDELRTGLRSRSNSRGVIGEWERPQLSTRRLEPHTD